MEREIGMMDKTYLITKKRIALFIDLENLIGFSLSLGLPIDIKPIINKLIEFGNVAIRRSFGDIEATPHLNDRKLKIRKMLQSNLVQHEDIPHYNQYKNTADIRLVVEAISLAYTYPDIEYYAIVAYDQDYMPLFAKLRELGKTIIGVGSSVDSTKELYVKSCDFFIYYESLYRFSAKEPQQEEDVSSIVDSYCSLLLNAIRSLEQQGSKPVGALIMPLVRQMKPDFDLSLAKMNSFRDLVDLAQKRNLVNAEPSGQDLLVTLVNDQGGIADATIQFNGDDSQKQKSYYRDYIVTKLKCRLLTKDERKIIYEKIDDYLFENEKGISLVDLSYHVIEGTKIYQPEAYKLLYTLFRARCFQCSYHPNNPIIEKLAIEKEKLDHAFIKNLLLVMRHEIQDVPLFAKPICQVFYANEDEIDEIKHIIDDVCSNEYA
jgi:uncharacterized LabA/DUF88 family protein